MAVQWQSKHESLETVLAWQFSDSPSVRIFLQYWCVSLLTILAWEFIDSPGMTFQWQSGRDSLLTVYAWQFSDSIDLTVQWQSWHDSSVTVLAWQLSDSILVTVQWQYCRDSVLARCARLGQLLQAGCCRWDQSGAWQWPVARVKASSDSFSIAWNISCDQLWG